MRSRILFGLTALVLGAATAATAAAPRAAAAGASNVTSTAASTWQTNDTVWALAAANGVVYFGGSFTSVRPPGDPSGTGEVARTYLAAYSASTGDLLTSFHPTLDGSVRALAVSPDGNTLYVGGSFTHAGGSYRPYLAAFNISASPPTGGLLSWAPHASASVLAIAPSPDGSAIYIGGNFGTLKGATRNRAGAVDASGNLLAWNPNLNGSVDAVAVARDDSRVLVGGWFTSIGGVAQNSIASTDPSSGANEPWAATILPHTSTCTSAVKDIITGGSSAYIAAEGTGGGCFDGDFAANISNGSLVWQNDCLGATQALVIINGLLYKGSHAHDCAFAPGGFPEVAKPSGGLVTWHLLDQSLADGSLGHWTPDTNGVNLGPRVFATDGSQLFVGGGFTTVNGVPQQGLTRFPPGPDTTKPKFPAAPTAISTSAGVDSVTFNGVSDRDDGTLTYSIYRDSSTTPIATVTATSWPWALPVIHYRDAGLSAGTTHTYRIRVSDGTNTTSFSPASAPVTVTGTSPSHTYPQTVLNDTPSFFWRLDETSGSTAADSTTKGFTGIYEPGTTQGVTGPIPGDSATATAFDGSTGLVTAAKAVSGPPTFSAELWFKTRTNTGGKLIGFGSSQTGRSSSYDRHIYMMNDGQLVFGVYNGQPETIETPGVYNDGQWHYVVATIGSAGMALYVDGRRVGTNSTTTPQAFTGYWRVGGDNLRGWSLDSHTNSQGLTQPNSYYFQGTIGDVAVYPRALSAAQVATHYAANALSH